MLYTLTYTELYVNYMSIKLENKRTFHLVIVHGMFTNIDHILDHKASLNKYI